MQQPQWSDCPLYGNRLAAAAPLSDACADPTLAVVSISRRTNGLSLSYMRRCCLDDCLESAYFRKSAVQLGDNGTNAPGLARIQ
jgi:hypothetical protein